MAVVWSRNLPGPRSHALVVGVSDYANLPPFGKVGGGRTLGLAKLRCAALAAYRFRQWLETARDDLVPPLASIRMMLAPSPEEIATEPALAGGFDRPAFAAFKLEADAWRKANDEDEGASIFYFAGHGLQRDKESSLILFEDFAQAAGGAFDNTARVQNIVDGMAASVETPTIAQTQYYFVDACRNEPVKMTDFNAVTPGVVFDDLNKKDERAVAVFQATSLGYETNGQAGGTTFFCDALLEALDRSSDRAEMTDNKLRWIVSADMLRQGINDALVARDQPPRAPLGGAASREMLLRRLKTPPPVDMTIKLNPDECVPVTTVDLKNLATGEIHKFGAPPDPHPFGAKVDMGIYLMEALTQAPFVSYKSQPYQVTFRNRMWSVELERQ